MSGAGCAVGEGKRASADENGRGWPWLAVAPMCRAHFRSGEPRSSSRYARLYRVRGVVGTPVRIAAACWIWPDV
jgi:hypothetical protein